MVWNPLPFFKVARGSNFQKDSRKECWWNCRKETISQCFNSDSPPIFPIQVLQAHHQSSYWDQVSFYRPKSLRVLTN